MEAQRPYGEGLHQKTVAVDLEKISVNRVQQLIREKLEELAELQRRHTKLTGSRFRVI